MELTLPGRQPKDKYCLWVEAIFSKAECEQLIAFAEAQSFEPASLIKDPETGNIMKNPNRNNDRVSLFNEEIATKLYARLLPYLPSSWTYEGETWVPDSCNLRMSFLRYYPKEHYSPHVDVEYVTPDGSLRSFITIQLYLNEGFTGGMTRFIQEVGYTRIDDRQFLDVIPKTGAVLLFEHELLHTGCPVEEGCKYTIRTDIMFRRKPD